ncbi:MAG: Replicative DNA helicase DnaC [Parcubacteria group bacterium GW2011_GWA2_51_10]|nr:MAG: Replicative DNA helicase DnaC [Parcubacteria group bacterium GW2011_GWA2_51_10]
MRRRPSESSVSRGEIRGVPTGFSQLDNLLAGLQKSDLILLAARPSVGKTALALDIARQTAIKHGTSVGIFSLEMSSQQLVDRMLAAQAGVNSWRLRTGKISKDEEYERLHNGMAALSEAPIYIDDRPSSTVLSMRSVARRLKMEKGLGLIIVDYLQLITPLHSRGGDSMVQQVTEISRSLKAMARELDVPVMALSQLSRAIESRRGKPRLSDLRDSGSLEQDADVVMFIHRDDKMNENSDRPGIAEIMVEKHRNGPIGKVDLRFDEEKTTFLSIEKSEFGDFTPETQMEDTAPF